MGRKSKKKRRSGNTFFLLILIGIIASMVFFFGQEIRNSLKPSLEKRDILQEKKEVVIYFSDHESEYLIGEKRQILKRDEVYEEAKEVVIELIKGPTGKLIPTLPPQTKLLGLQINEGGIARVNFNQALSKDHPGGSSAEMMTIYSIVNSLTLNFPQIKQVQILMEGEVEETVAGHHSLKQPISSNPDLIKKLK